MSALACVGGSLGLQSLGEAAAQPQRLIRKSMHPGLIDNPNLLFELKCPSSVRIIRACQ